MAKIKNTTSYKKYIKRICRNFDLQINNISLSKAVLEQIVELLERKIKTLKKQLNKNKTLTSSATYIRALEEQIEKLKKIHEDNKKYDNVFREILFITYVNYFLLYLSDIQEEILIKKPILLGGDKNILLSDFIYKKKSEIIEDEIKEFVYKNSYKNFKDTSTMFKNKFHIKMFHRNKQLELAYIIIEKRNLFVHNDGKVNKRFNKKTKLKKKLRSQLIIKENDLKTTRTLLNKIALKINEQTMTNYFKKDQKK